MSYEQIPSIPGVLFGKCMVLHILVNFSWYEEEVGKKFMYNVL